MKNWKILALIILAVFVVGWSPYSNPPPGGTGSAGTATWPTITSKPEITVGDTGYATLAAAVTAIGSTPATLVVPAGTHTVSADTTIPATLTLKPMPNALITIASGKTLSISGHIVDCMYQIFVDNSGSLSKGVKFLGGSVDFVRPEWWGARSCEYDDTTQIAINPVAINQALNAGYHILYGGTVNLATTVRFDNGSYFINNQIVMPDLTKIIGQAIGFTFYQSAISWSTSDHTNAVISMGAGCEVAHIFVAGDGSPCDGIDITNNGSNVHHCFFAYLGTDASGDFKNFDVYDAQNSILTILATHKGACLNYTGSNEHRADFNAAIGVNAFAITRNSTGYESYFTNNIIYSRVVGMVGNLFNASHVLHNCFQGNYTSILAGLVSMDSLSQSWITGNRIDSSYYGMIMYGEKTDVTDNVVAGAAIGYKFAYTGSAKISGNKADGCFVPYVYAGPNLGDSSVIKDNIITSPPAGSLFTTFIGLGARVGQTSTYNVRGHYPDIRDNVPPGGYTIGGHSTWQPPLFNVDRWGNAYGDIEIGGNDNWLMFGALHALSFKNIWGASPPAKKTLYFDTMIGTTFNFANTANDSNIIGNGGQDYSPTPGDKMTIEPFIDGVATCTITPFGYTNTTGTGTGSLGAELTDTKSGAFFPDTSSSVAAYNFNTDPGANGWIGIGATTWTWNTDHVTKIKGDNTVLYKDYTTAVLVPGTKYLLVPGTYYGGDDGFVQFGVGGTYGRVFAGSCGDGLGENIIAYDVITCGADGHLSIQTDGTVYPGTNAHSNVKVDGISVFAATAPKTWTVGAGWTYHPELLPMMMQHTSGTAALSQSITVAAGTYLVKFRVVGRSAGTITPSIGAATGTASQRNGYQYQKITAIGTGSETLAFTPTTNFDGYVSSVSVRLINP